MAPWRFTGNWGVGIADLQFLEDGAWVSPTHVPFDKHLVGRLYYPTSARWCRGERWLPGFSYAVGMGKFLFFRWSGILASLLQVAITGLSYLLGRSERMDVQPGAPLGSPAHDGGLRHPVVVFSHGLGGHRGMYSVICGELASQGYLVLAVEHADGTASCCHLAGPSKACRFYKGLGGEEGQVQKVRDRVVEMQTARRALKAMAAGHALPGLELSHSLDAATFLRDKLDMGCLAAVGHSYGGATVAALVSEDPGWSAGIALDPWWPALPPEAAALHGWRTKVPLMIQPSHDWSVPNAWGQLTCDGERQAAVLAAARARGAGALRLVTNGSSHNTFADALPLFGSSVGWILGKLNLSARLDPVLGVYLSSLASLAFLATHLPLSPAQRRLQAWEPAKDGYMLRLVRARDAAGAAQAAPPLRRGGLLSRLVPRQDLLYAVSDWMLNVTLRIAAKAGGAGGLGGGIAGGSAAADGADGSSAGAAGKDGVQRSQPQPDDIADAVEALETLLPSADPAAARTPTRRAAPPTRPTSRRGWLRRQRRRGARRTRWATRGGPSCWRGWARGITPPREQQGGAGAGGSAGC